MGWHCKGIWVGITGYVGWHCRVYGVASQGMWDGITGYVGSSRRVYTIRGEGVWYGGVYPPLSGNELNKELG